MVVFVLAICLFLFHSSQTTFAANVINPNIPIPTTIQHNESNDGTGASSAGTPKDPGQGISTIYMTPKQAGKTVNQLGQNIYTKQPPDVCANLDKTLSAMITCPLLYVLKFAGWLLESSVVLFAYIIDADKISQILTSGAIISTWTDIRDLLNVSFILILLFSAFSTIFQVDKYNYKKILLTLVIMALLVNFSYPITRFIIDISNSLMYTVLNHYFSNYSSDPGQIITKMDGFSTLQSIIVPTAARPEITQLLASIVFIFVLALTILAMAILFLVRIIALAILIIFSPVAFVGSIVGKGGEWWSYLFKYALFGPIMAVMLAISINLMKAMNDASLFSTTLIDGKTNVIDESIITAMSRFAIPITVLWIGMGVAQKMGIAGASEVIGNAQKAAKWVGAGMVKAPFKVTGVSDGVKARWERYKKTGPLFGSDKIAERAARIEAIGGDNKVGKFLGGNKNALDELQRKKIAEIRKTWKDNGGATENDITNGLAGGGLKAEAAAMEAAENTGFGNNTVATTNYQNALKAIKGNASLESLFNNKVKEKHIRFVIENEISTTNAAAPAAKNAIYEKHLGNMSAESLAKQRGLHENSDFHNYLWEEVVINNNDTEFIAETAKKLDKKARGSWRNAGLI